MILLIRFEQWNILLQIYSTVMNNDNAKRHDYSLFLSYSTWNIEFVDRISNQFWWQIILGYINAVQRFCITEKLEVVISEVSQKMSIVD